MRIALIAPPFIAVPPAKYGGTELFISHLADALDTRGHDVVVYANGDSRVRGELRWRYRHADWPVADAAAAHWKNADHTGWAIHDAAMHADVLHINDAVGIPFTRFVDVPAVATLHHSHEPALSNLYTKYPDVQYIAISESQARREPMPRMHVVHHGLTLDDYRPSAQKDDYVVFLGRMAPCKGAHLAVEAARLAGIKLKLAGEVQPVFREYWDTKVAPQVGGNIEYVGEADLAAKNALLSRARALLFPIEWDEPFGLAMIEAMACGTPVLAFGRGSVPEIVSDGVSGWICRNTADMAARIASPGIGAESCRAWVERHFSCDRMADRYLEIYDRAQADRVHAPGAGQEVAWKT
jgi:glycosyltransferase involved in cell wall biosynthesis